MFQSAITEWHETFPMVSLAVRYEEHTSETKSLNQQCGWKGGDSGDSAG